MPTTTKDEWSRSLDVMGLNGTMYKWGDPLLIRRRERTWVRTPRYAALRASGASLPQNMYTYTDYQLTPMTGRVVSTYGVEFIVGPYAGLVSELPSDPGIPLNDLNKILINRAKGQQWNVPVFFAEAGKTGAMVAARAKHLALMANDLRRGNIPAFFKRMHHTVIPPKGKKPVERFNREYGRNAQNAAANAWLEYSYGWVPFMNDVRAAVNTLMDISDRPTALTATVTAKTRSSSKTQTAPGSLRLIAWGTQGIDSYGHTETTTFDNFRAKWKFRPMPLELPGKLGLTNPMEVAWELVPFSFVVDWFLPIGDYLSSLDAPLRFQHISGSYGSRRERTITSTVDTRVKQPFSGKCYSVFVRRTPMSSAPSFSFIRGLKFSTGQSGRQVTSALALLNQQLSRLKPRRTQPKVVPEPRRNLSFPEHYEHL